MNWFLVQVSASRGYDNIMNNRRYANTLWMTKPRDSDHGQVEPEDKLLVYCTSNVRTYGRSLAFSVVVKDVGANRVTFDL